MSILKRAQDKLQKAADELPESCIIDEIKIFAPARYHLEFYEGDWQSYLEVPDVCRINVDDKTLEVNVRTSTERDGLLWRAWIWININHKDMAKLKTIADHTHEDRKKFCMISMHFSEPIEFRVGPEMWD